MQRSADHGPPRNEDLCRKLEGNHAEGLYEFKAINGGRILWFYDMHRRHIIICTHGFEKKKQDTPPSEIKRAQRIRQQHKKENAK